MTDEPASVSRRSLVLVAGAGRSGTSTFSGILQRLGHAVPQPEVPPDESNPRGFAESRWVVDFHKQMLRTVLVVTADARPDAWALTATAADDAAADELRTFLKAQFDESDHVLIKDPRLTWFLPLWRRVAADLGVTPRCITMLRHPAAVVQSSARHYGSRRTPVSRAAGWLNTMLYTERATRNELRAFVRYDDVLDDWAKVTARVADSLALHAVAEASTTQMRLAEEFVDPSLPRSTPSWDDVRMPTALRDQADNVWELLCRLAEPDAHGDDIFSRLDEARRAYADLYEEAEAIAQSSVLAAERMEPPRKPPPPEAAVTKWIPRRLRRRVPTGARRAVLTLFGGAGPRR